MNTPDLSSLARNTEHVRRHAVHARVLVFADLLSHGDEEPQIIVPRRNGAAHLMDVAAPVDLQESDQIKSSPVVARPGQHRKQIVKPKVAVPRVRRAIVVEEHFLGAAKELPRPTLTTKPCPAPSPSGPIFAVVARDWKSAEFAERHGWEKK